MPELTETLESIQAEEASIRTLFGGDRRVREGQNRGRNYQKHLIEAGKFLAQIYKGSRPMSHLREAMTTSDFPLLFADILDRQLLAAYQETVPTYQNYTRVSTVPDFRPVKRFALDGAESVLPPVDEREEYPEAALTDSEDTYAVRKYGRRLDLSWETMINDDLDSFRRNPDRLARAARRSESKFAVGLFVDVNGPHASLYTGGHANVVPGNPELSIASLQAAFTLLAAQVDEDGEPILIETVELVVPPALEVVAQNILNAQALWVGDSAPNPSIGGAAGQTLQTANWMRGRTRVNIEHYIPHVATGAHGSSSWFLFANPSTGRPALELGKLRGYETPALYERMSDARQVGGGGGEVMESFDDDSHAWRVRHVFGGTRLTNTGGFRATVASNGSGTS